MAERKIEGLRECGAAITVVSPELTPALMDAAIREDFRYNKREFLDRDLEGKRLAIAATDNSGLNDRIAQLCQTQGIPVNVVDMPRLCTFFVPSVIRRGSLCISISTCGDSPMLARRIREDLEKQFGSAFEEIVPLLGDMRRRILENLPDEAKRRQCWDEIVTPELIALLKAGKAEIARKQVETICTSLLSE